MRKKGAKGAPTDKAFRKAALTTKKPNQRRKEGLVMNYGQVKSHFEALLNRSDNTSALTTTFLDQGIRAYHASFALQ